MKSHAVFQEELQKVMGESSSQELFDYMEENIVCFFSSPYISDYYQILRDADVSASRKMQPKLIKAWLAFLCGDNAGLESIVRYVDELELEGPWESSFYYALKAMMGLSADHQEELKYAKLSVDVLPEQDCSIFMANAKLTYAQLLAGLEQNRTAIGLFEDSYRLFYRMDSHFPAVIALVNGLLNRYWLGEFNRVIDECRSTLVRSASFREEVQDYWNVVNLPLGMCYYEMNKPSLAIQHLEQAKSCIDRMGLFHMHGLLEFYLFKSYHLLRNKAGMEKIRDQAEIDFQHMHYTMTDLLLCMFRIMSFPSDNRKELQPHIERLELEYIRDGEKSHMILVEALAYLRINELSDTPSAEDMAKSLNKLRYNGKVPYIQLFLILLAEIHFMEGRHMDAAELLKEAAAVYREYGISASFYIYPLKSLPLLLKIDQRLYNDIVRKSDAANTAPHSSILSTREKEIMQLVAQGKGNEEISKILFISVGTIKWHINHIFSKLEVSNRMQASEKAKSLGEIS